jgi:hypothetical protein
MVVGAVAHLHLNSSPVWPLVADSTVPCDMFLVGMAACAVTQLVEH